MLSLTGHLLDNVNENIHVSAHPLEFQNKLKHVHLVRTVQCTRYDGITAWLHQHSYMYIDMCKVLLYFSVIVMAM